MSDLGIVLAGVAVIEFVCGFFVGRASERLRQRGESPFGALTKSIPKRKR